MISRENIQDVYPLSPLQEGMLYESQRGNGTAAHFEQVTWRIRGGIDIDAFKQAWLTLADRHASLRTVIVAEKASRPVQVVLRSTAPEIHVVDLGGLDLAFAIERFEEFRSRERLNPPDTRGVRLWSVALFKLPAEQFIVMFSFHHIILDGWSFGLLLNDLQAIYGALLQKKPVPPRDWPKFATFIKHIESADLGAARRFWTERLEAAPDRSAVPEMRPRSAGHTIPINIGRKISVEKTRKIEALARDLAVTVSSVLQAVWGLLLARHNDERAAVFASVVSGRSGDLEDVENIVGMCINTIPCVVVSKPEDSFADLVRRLHGENAEAAPFQHVPLAEVQGPGRIGTLFAFENFPIHPAEFGIESASLEVQSVDSIEEVPYPVTLVAVPGESLSLLFKFDPRVHDHSEIDHVADRFKALLDAALQKPEGLVDELEILPAGESRLIEQFGRTSVSYEDDATIDRLFRRVVEAQPDVIALQDGADEISYKELDRRVTSLAANLRSGFRLEKGRHVAVCLDRCPDLVVAFLAIVRAGGVYVPIDPAQPAERSAFMLADCRPAVVIATAEDLERLPAPQGTLRLASRDFPIALRAAAMLPDLQATDAVYAIYTSGSTGQPKGSIIAHRGLVNLFGQLGRVTEMGPAKSFAMIHSPSFDASILEILTPILNGGRLVIGRREVVADPERFSAFLREERPSVALITPAHLRLLEPDDVGVLETLIVGGEAADADVLAKYISGRRVINAYGPSEASIAATYHVLTADDVKRTNVPIGRPFENVDVVIVDRLGRLSPIGAPGEILIGGAALGLGYLDRPALVTERFVDHPLLKGEKIYRTGDCGRWREDGTIDYLGRLDDQVKIRGFRVEPGEVQVRLAAHPEVEQAVVIARRSGGGASALHGYVVAPESVTSEGLRTYLARSLPDYMVPSAIVRLDAFPLTPSGKIDRGRLPLPEATRGRRPADTSLDEVELELLKIWRDVLEEPFLDVDANFLASGGHSLAAMRIVTRVRKDLQRQLSLDEFFRNETVRALADCLRRKATEALTPISRSSSRELEALSHAQSRIWVLHQLGYSRSAYNIAAAFILQGDLEREAMKIALSQLVTRHEALRTVFPVIDGVPRQRLLETMAADLSWFDVSGEAFPESTAVAAAQALLQAPFDLERGPVARFGVYRLGEARHFFVFAVHHIAFDGWSAEILARDLSRLYVAARAGGTAELPALRISLVDAARWLNDRASGAITARQYWLNRFSDLPAPLELATDRPRPAVPSQTGGEVPVRLSIRTLDSLAALGGPGTTRFMALVALVKLLLYRYSGQTDITVGHPIAGRDHPDLEPLIGCFVNTLALRDQLSGVWTFRHLMEAVRRTAVAAFDHSAYPFDLLVEELGVVRSLNRNPLFDVMVLFAPKVDRPVDFGGLVIEVAELPGAIAKFDLMFDFREGVDGIEGRISFSSDLFERETIVQMANHIATLAESANRNPSMPLSHLPLLTDQERNRQLGVLGEQASDAQEPECLHVQFERRVAEAPEAIALVFGDERITYSVLNARADHLAHRLRALGVGPEVPVGLSLRRSVDLLVGILGILKAGGAYVPLDPSYPDQRLHSIVETAGLEIIVAGSGEASRLSGGNRQIVGPSQEGGGTPAAPTAAIPDKPSVDSLAYVLFTSGSTGEPKGVAVTHRNVARLFTMVQPRFGLSPKDIVCQFHSYAFDVSVFEIWAALLNGATLVLVPAETMRSPPDMLDLLVRERVTLLCQTPSAFAPLVDADVAAGAPPLALRFVVLAGEALDAQSLAPWIESRGDARPKLINMYGPTETTVYVTYHEVSKADLERTASVIGKGFSDTPILILDRDRQLLPWGAIGEAYIGGPGVARGYFNRPDLTAERFVGNPFATSSCDTLYRTGDLARFLADGSIEYHGRADHQVKIRGFRVELSEIEARLSAHPDVQSCVVVTRKQTDSLELVGHVTLRKPVTAVILQQHLRQFLPSYMIPAHIMVHERMPLNVSGKIDRRALPEPGLHATGRQSGEEPATPTEKSVAGIWVEVLKRNNICRNDDFFDLGGHSLNAMQIITRINKTFGSSLQVRALFEHSVLLDLALAVEENILQNLSDEDLLHVLDGQSGQDDLR